jgi:hypothetical protein
MSIATRADTQSPAPVVADSHDLIRVHGARVNNLKDVSIEIPKRRLTVFTGVSGSGKSSLVFGTIAAESQRLINETYSAFVQGFMPTLARARGRRARRADDRDHRRPGADGRQRPLHVGTATDANAMLRISFSRPGSRTSARPNAFSFNVPSVRRGAGAITVERGPGITVRPKLHRHRRHVPACEGRGFGHPTSTCRSCTTTASPSTRVRSRSPATAVDGWYEPHLQRLRLRRPGQADPQVHQEEAHDLLTSSRPRSRSTGST